MRFNCGQRPRKRRRGRLSRKSRRQGEQERVDWRLRNRLWKEITTFASYIGWNTWSRCTARLDLDPLKISQHIGCWAWCL